jgi:NAD(P) transhydrogenase subunit alpha
MTGAEEQPMCVNVAVLKETHPQERRVALVPSVAAKLIKLGARIRMQRSAGAAINLADAAFANVNFTDDRDELVGDADVVLAVQPPALDVVSAMKEGSILVSFIYGNKEPALMKRLLEKKITCFAMECVPRITRAEACDAPSSRSALAGYYAVLLGSTHLGRILIGSAKVLVMGLGVAGLESIATARRLGAVVEGYDVRPETAERARSLGAKFVDTAVEDVLTQHIQQADLVITTAVPGRPSPKLITRKQVAGMKAGAVIVDLSAEGGGNCEDTQPGKTARVGTVTIIASLNVPSLGEDASHLYAQNQYALLALMLKDNVITIDWKDQILQKTVLTHAGHMGDGN